MRINQLSFALLYLFGRPLPNVFHEAIMKPIGASDHWRWVGYDNAWINLNGRRVQSVPGGTHWGGGLSISSHDQARIGQMMLDDGNADGRQVISPDWLRHMRTPCRIAPFYGYLIWLNHERSLFPSVPASSYLAIGAGGNFTWIEPERRMVLVVRSIHMTYADVFFPSICCAVSWSAGTAAGG